MSRSARTMPFVVNAFCGYRCLSGNSTRSVEQIRPVAAEYARLVYTVGTQKRSTAEAEGPADAKRLMPHASCLGLRHARRAPRACYTPGRFQLHRS
jgi:hypothetical protein